MIKTNFRSPPSRRSIGVTLTEMLLAGAALGLLVLGAAKLFRALNMSLVKQKTASESLIGDQKIMGVVEMTLYKANEPLVIAPTQLEFIADYNCTPHYDPLGDIDGDGIVNQDDTDVDNDAAIVMVPPNLNKVGLNLQDDDDDNDGKIDMRYRLFFAANALYVDYSVNEEPMGNHVSKIGDHILSFSFTAFGSRDFLGGSSLDANSDGLVSMSEMDIGADGLPGTGDAGEGDGVLDKPAELQYVTSLGLTLQIDVNGDGKSDNSNETSISPPMIVLKQSTL